jgi:hypothetical protein
MRLFNFQVTEEFFQIFCSNIMHSKALSRINPAVGLKSFVSPSGLNVEQLGLGVSMQTSEEQWSAVEREIVQIAFQRAYEREISSLMELVKLQVLKINQIDDLWRISDFLNSKRHEIDGKYDSEPSALLFTLSRLIKDQWIRREELQGLEKDKLAKITALAKM